MKHIRHRWPDEGWLQLLSAGRIDKAKELQRLRMKNIALEVELLDCLQFSDKLNISINEPDFLKVTGFMSAKAAKRAIKDLEALRNNLAHGQDITSQDWPPIARLAGGCRRCSPRQINRYFRPPLQRRGCAKADSRQLRTAGSRR